MKYEIPIFGEGYIEMSEKVGQAYLFAKNAHEGQVRKYTAEPYIVHPVEVMSIVQSVSNREDMLCAALLHDVVEDCEVSLRDIEAIFGCAVMFMVEDLTDVSIATDGNRQTRKEIDRAHTARSFHLSKTIKLADLISNSKSICEHDKEFAKVYIKEKELLLEVLKEGDQTLWNQANEIVQKAKKELGIK